MKYTIKDFRKQFPDDKACLAFLYKARYPRGAECDGCHHKDCFYPIAGRKSYVCSWCGHQLSPTADTIFHKSPTPLMSWFHAIFLFSTAKNGVAAKEIQRQLGVTYKCAWRICRQIRLLMAEDGGTLGGMLEADESYIGGKHSGGKRGVGAEGKTPVFGVVERGGKINLNEITIRIGKRDYTVREDGRIIREPFEFVIWRGDSKMTDREPFARVSPPARAVTRDAAEAAAWAARAVWLRENAKPRFSIDK